jgi:hypothetical protein
MAFQITPLQIVLTDTDADRTPLAGGSVTFFQSGTTSLATIYANDAGSVALDNPLEADSTGAIVQVFKTATYDVKAVIRRSDGSLVQTIDPCALGISTGLAASEIVFTASSGNPATNVQDAIDGNTDRLDDLGTPGVTGIALLATGSATDARTALGLGGLATQSILDEDNFATNSATRPPSQQSTKAYHTANTALTLSFESTGNAIASGAQINVTHGLSTKPKSVQISLVNVTGEYGFSTGDEIIATMACSDASVSRFNALRITTSRVIIRLSSATECFATANDGTGAAVALTNANWTLTVRAYA